MRRAGAARPFWRKTRLSTRLLVDVEDHLGIGDAPEEIGLAFRIHLETPLAGQLGEQAIVLAGHEDEVCGREPVAADQPL